MSILSGPSRVLLRASATMNETALHVPLPREGHISGLGIRDDDGRAHLDDHAVGSSGSRKEVHLRSGKTLIYVTILYRLAKRVQSVKPDGLRHLNLDR
jgi:hypothetical protein